MKKKLICFTTATTIAMGASVPVLAAGKTATPNNASVAVNGKAIAIGAYNIDGYNYFKLRDVAAALNGTGANFTVGYDNEVKSITLISKTAYAATGKELQDTAPTAKKTAAVSNQKILLDGTEVSMQAYLIDGYNYFQLRELGKNLGFEVAWDNDAKAINMVTEETAAEAPKEEVKEDVKEEVKEETDVQKLQKLVDSTEFQLDFSGTYVGKPGDKLVISKSMAIYGDNAVLKNITVEINTDGQVWLEGITLDGTKTTDHAIIIRTVGPDSAIARCTIQNYNSDAIVIDKVVEGSTFIIGENKFSEYGLAETKMDGAITLNAAEKAKVTYHIWNNTFTLSKDVEDEEKMDVAFQTNTVENEEEIYSETIVDYSGNSVKKGSFETNSDIAAAIADGNLTIS